MNKFLFTSIMCLITLFTSSQNLKSPNNNLDLNFSIDENGRATNN